MTQTKTERVVEAMKGRKNARQFPVVTIADIRAQTGLEAHEIGGILASLERQDRAMRVEVKDAIRNHWRLLRAERRPRSSVDPDSVPFSMRERFECEARSNEAAVMLQNIVLGFGRRSAMAARA